MTPDERTDNVLKRMNRIIKCALNMAPDWVVRNRIEEIEIHSGYAEPGYSSELPIATGNWNSVYDSTGKVNTLPERISDLFQKMGVECEWSDEWTTCCECYKLVRTGADCYSWTPSYHQDIDGEIVCLECLKQDPVSYLANLEGNINQANMIKDINPVTYDYIKVNDEPYRTGWAGISDDPSLIVKDLEAKGISRYLFNISKIEQFQSFWDVYVHKDEYNFIFHVEDDKENENCSFVSFDKSSDKIVNLNNYPCKFCGTGLNQGETPCWKCGTDNPTK